MAEFCGGIQEGESQGVSGILGDGISTGTSRYRCKQPEVFWKGHLIGHP